jgi:probable phosphoglycerate mutase
LKAKKIYLIRHGETDYNLKGVVQGSGIDASLNETGIKQARLFYERYRKIGFQKVYISALKRTHQSVQAFIDDGIPYEKLPGLNEISWGISEGKPFSNESHNDYIEMVEKWKNGETFLKVQGGESPDEVEIRQKQAIRYILNQENEDLILVCMHGRAMRILLCWLLGQSLHCMDDYAHNNLGLYIINYSDDKFSIESFNDITHLMEIH